MKELLCRRRDGKGPFASAAEVLVFRSPILALLAMIAVPACSAADDPAERPPADAGRDTRPRYDALVDRNDAGESDVEGDGEKPRADAGTDAAVPPIDVVDAPLDVDAATETSVPDAVVDGSPPRDADATSNPGDAAVDPIVTTCLVSFTVTGVRWDADGGPPDGGQAPARVVRLVGDAANLGSWAPTAGALLAEGAAGTWSGTTTFRDQQLVEFKFVKLEGATPEWESWQPFDSNRSLRVECSGDAGVLVDALEGGPSDVASDAAEASFADAAPDAATSDAAPEDATTDPASDATSDTSDASDDVRVTTGPARGQRYTGVFGVRPPDATK